MCGKVGRLSKSDFGSFCGSTCGGSTCLYTMVMTANKRNNYTSRGAGGISVANGFCYRLVDLNDWPLYCIPNFVDAEH